MTKTLELKDYPQEILKTIEYHKRYIVLFKDQKENDIAKGTTDFQIFKDWQIQQHEEKIAKMEELLTFTEALLNGGDAS